MSESPTMPLTDTSEIDVPDELFHRHLGLPPSATIDEGLAELAADALRWYHQFGQPWATTREIEIKQNDGRQVQLVDGTVLTSELLARGLQNADAHAIVTLAVSAGPEVDEQIQSLWQDDRPDESMFLNAYAVAMTEHLRKIQGERIAQEMQQAGLTVLPHYSPGYEGWGLHDQARLFELISTSQNGSPLPGPLELLESGALRPSKSTLAVFGVSRRTDLDSRLRGYWDRQGSSSSGEDSSKPREYAFPEKALRRWAKERLSLTAQADGRLRARFRFEGTTCNNTGWPLAFDYHVDLHCDEPGRYQVEACRCDPTKGDTGYQGMCGFRNDPDSFLARVQSNSPSDGQTLENLLDWHTETSPAGCLCTLGNQNHKWRIVLHTIHFALTHNNETMSAW